MPDELRSVMDQRPNQAASVGSAEEGTGRADRDDGNCALIVCEEFSVLYDNTPAVDRLSVAIPQGEITTLIGPSGCGKSTFLASVNRMTDLVPGCTTRGKMRLNGEDIHAATMDVIWLRRRIGMVSQKPNPFPKSIFANVAYGPKLHGLAADRGELDEIVEASLRKAALWVDVKDRLRSSALGLSGGQQQRLCIARALAVQPEVLLFDEPTSSLDAGSTAKIEDLLAGLRDQYTVIMVTHNVQQASRVSDNTMFLQRGELVEFGRTDEMFLKPQHAETEKYITGSFG